MVVGGIIGFGIGRWSPGAPGVGAASLQLGTEAALASLEPGANKVRDEIMKNLAEIAVYNGGTSGLGEWFGSLPTDAAGQSAREGAFYQVYHHMMHASREEASQFLKENATGVWRSDRGYQEYVSALAKESPQTAMDWLRELPQREEQPSWPGASDVIANWKQTAVQHWRNGAIPCRILHLGNWCEAV